MSDMTRYSDQIVRIDSIGRSGEKVANTSLCIIDGEIVQLYLGNFALCRAKKASCIKCAKFSKYRGGSPFFFSF